LTSVSKKNPSFYDLKNKTPIIGEKRPGGRRGTEKGVKEGERLSGEKKEEEKRTQSSLSSIHKSRNGKRGGGYRRWK